ncbi:hypothetical protein FC77_GL001386 [Lactobacillus acetotolerans DSM 20749 = JCM 3825]|nr:hypothetical protein FC77_GL001386 [Lactobacillus acetotolerans DSM 20749 = JCM 3825]
MFNLRQSPYAKQSGIKIPNDTKINAKIINPIIFLVFVQRGFLAVVSRYTANKITMINSTK